jgi:drug/metabolite transporter (DMT)-like permease
MPVDRKLRLDAAAIALVMTCCLIWGVNQVAAKVALAEWPPLLQAGLRSLGAAVLVALWCRWRGIALLTRDGTARAGVLAGLLFAAEFACIFIGLQHTAASRMAVFIYLCPFFVALGLPLVARGERVGLAQAAGLALAFAGVLLAFGESFGPAAADAPRQWLGDALGVTAAMLWALTTLVVRGSRLATVAPEKALQWQLVVSGCALTAAGLAAGEVLPSSPSAQAWGLLGFQVAVVTFASYLAWFWLIRHYPVTPLSAFTMLTPVFGLAAGVALLGEPATPQLLLALAAVCGGIALVHRAAPRPSAPRPPHQETSP